MASASYPGELLRHFVASPEATKIAAALINRYPERFLFGTDEVASENQEQYLKIYSLYGPLWKLLTPEASEKVRKSNYERLFDEARRRVRAWERANLRAISKEDPAPAPHEEVQVPSAPNPGQKK